MKKLFLFTLAAIYLQSCTQVTPKEAGFKISNSGDYRGVDSLPLLTGYNFFMPGLSQIITIPTTIQHVVWSENKQEGSNENEHIVVNCKGGSGFKVDVGINYRVNPNKASKIYLKYKTDNLETLSQTYLRNMVRGAMQDVSGYMTVDSMLNNLPFYENQVRTNLTIHFANEGLTLDNFNIISMPRPVDPNLAISIASKIKAKQDAETAIQQLAISVAEANKKIATAKGDSASAVIEAAGEAEAIKKKQTVLTAEYVEFIKASNWDGKLPTTVAGGSGMFLNLK